MIELYGMGSPNVVKILVALEELGLPYTLRPVDVLRGEQFAADFVKLNPNAKVPVIIDPDGPEGKRYVCFESGAILLYLAEKTGRLLPRAAAARFEAIQWLMVQVSTVGPAFGQCIHYHRFAPAEGNDYARSRYTTQAIRTLEAIERRLTGAAWLNGSEYGIADIATWPWARIMPNFLSADMIARIPATTRWIAEVAARPAVAAAMERLAKLSAATTALSAATPDEVDRFFARGKFAAA